MPGAPAFGLPNATLVATSAAPPAAFDITIFIWLLLVASAVGMVAKRLQLPYALALVLTGLAMGLTRLLPGAQLDPHTLFTLFLPPLLFEAAINLNADHLRDDWLPITTFSLVGTVLATVAAGWAFAWGTGIPLTIALVFGALTAPTDPISVIAVLKRLRANARLTLLVEAESLFNDGVGVVVFLVVLGLATGQSTAFVDVVNRFAVVMLGGVVVGGAVGALASTVTKRLDDHLIEITLTTLAAWGAYLAAEAVHASGVIAVVASGLVVGNYGMPRHMSAETRVAVSSFWEYAAFVTNSIVFLLIGIQADLVGWWQRPWEVLGAIACVLGARALVIYGLSWPLNRLGEDLPLAWQHVMVWGGLRGALSLALALGLPATLPYRDAIVAATFGYVLFSLLVQGLSVERVLHGLGLGARPARPDGGNVPDAAS